MKTTNRPTETIKETTMGTALKTALSVTAIASILFVAACDKGTETPPASNELTRAQLISLGSEQFSSCSGCHGSDGEGHPPSTPPLLHSDFLMASKERFVRIMLLGLPNDIDTATTITVNGVDYVGQGMPAIGEGFSDTAIAGLLTYLRTQLNDSSSVNCGPPVLDENDNPKADCDIVARAGVATDSVTPEEIAGYRALIP